MRFNWTNGDNDDVPHSMWNKENFIHIEDNSNVAIALCLALPM